MPKKFPKRHQSSAPLKVQLLSSDGQTFTVDDPVARRSGVIASVLEDCGYDEAIPLLNVPADVLAKVLEYCDHHQNDPTPPPDGEWNSGSADLKARRSSPIDPWDAQYITCDQETLFEVIQAASYLDIKALLDLGCKTVANMMTGKSVEEIRELFHIENDFTPEEEDAMQVERSQLERWHDALASQMESRALPTTGTGKGRRQIAGFSF